MYSEVAWTDRCELRCRGTVSPDGSGSVIEGKTRQDNQPLWVGQIFAGILAITLLRAPSWTALANGMALLTCYATFAALATVFLPQHARHEAEAAEFERILESAAWPPGTTGSQRATDRPRPVGNPAPPRPPGPP